MKRLYEVEARWYVMAEDEVEAESVRPIWGDYAVFVTEASGVDHDWFDALPFGGDDDRTCSQILSE
uniref:Uncharacterized protein n=1 Tax=viral metagenome TaxID=1070528 RepID=A0A6M3X6L1_9ZZZZ